MYVYLYIYIKYQVSPCAPKLSQSALGDVFLGEIWSADAKSCVPLPQTDTVSVQRLIRLPSLYSPVFRGIAKSQTLTNTDNVRYNHIYDYMCVHIHIYI